MERVDVINDKPSFENGENRGLGEFKSMAIECREDVIPLKAMDDILGIHTASVRYRSGQSGWGKCQDRTLDIEMMKAHCYSCLST